MQKYTQVISTIVQMKSTYKYIIQGIPQARKVSPPHQAIGKTITPQPEPTDYQQSLPDLLLGETCMPIVGVWNLEATKQLLKK